MNDTSITGKSDTLRLVPLPLDQLILSCRPWSCILGLHSRPRSLTWGAGVRRPGWISGRRSNVYDQVGRRQVPVDQSVVHQLHRSLPATTERMEER